MQVRSAPAFIPLISPTRSVYDACNARTAVPRTTVTGATITRTTVTRTTAISGGVFQNQMSTPAPHTHKPIPSWLHLTIRSFHHLTIFRRSPSRSRSRRLLPRIKIIILLKIRYLRIGRG